MARARGRVGRWGAGAIEPCADDGDCCGPIACQGGRCCDSNDLHCESDAACCTGKCVDEKCACSELGEPCVDEGHCCDRFSMDCSAGTCCLETDEPCSSAAECCSGDCRTNGRCA